MSAGDDHALPCARCGNEGVETIEHDGRALCEECRNATVCACEICRAADPLAAA
jgi:hypothetical protein